MPPSDLSADTRITAVSDGTYRADLPESWSYFTPSGGVLMTLALRAMIAELADPELSLVSASCIFIRRLPAGPLRVVVEVLRRGRSAVQVRAALRTEGEDEPGLEVSATFGRTRPGPDASGRHMPDVPAPEQCEDAGERALLADPARPRPVRPFFGNLDIRLALGAPVWRSDWQAGEARMAFWYRYRVSQLDAQGRLDPLAIPPIADTMPSALARRLGPDHERFYAPSLDLTVHFLDPGQTDWYLVDVRCCRARQGYASAHADVWDASGSLVAFATQTMILRPRSKR
jgi:acyl-CoA thioesterase